MENLVYICFKDSELDSLLKYLSSEENHYLDIGTTDKNDDYLQLSKNIGRWIRTLNDNRVYEGDAKLEIARLFNNFCFMQGMDTRICKVKCCFGILTGIGENDEVAAKQVFSQFINHVNSL